MTHWKRPWCWERLKAKREGGGRGWDGLMASLTQWTWIWANSGRQWRTEEPGILQSMGSQRVRHDLATEQRQQQRGRVECPRVCLLNICTLRGSLLSALHYWVFDEPSPCWARVWNPFLITVFSKPREHSCVVGPTLLVLGEDFLKCHAEHSVYIHTISLCASELGIVLHCVSQRMLKHRKNR